MHFDGKVTFIVFSLPLIFYAFIITQKVILLTE